MNIITIIIIAIGLSMDAFAVSISEGFAIKRPPVKSALLLALFLGFFQAMMPIMGWLAGVSLKNYITSIDHWVAFTLLFLIGLKMLYEGFYGPSAKKKDVSLRLSTLLVLAIATSIDALAIGITFSFLNISILSPILVIGAVTFIISLVGFFLGKKFGRFLGNKAKILGGILLIIIGTKILVDHLS
ncbi:MAG: manganese efflux pump MntP [Deltaproteobacteria bacterium GWA2_50_8]|nr:MAG: manganese efflux pump MntP [Deltaproteobacteria bacterium GWA2_50_8]